MCICGRLWRPLAVRSNAEGKIAWENMILILWALCGPIRREKSWKTAFLFHARAIGTYGRRMTPCTASRFLVPAAVLPCGVLYPDCGDICTTCAPVEYWFLRGRLEEIASAFLIMPWHFKTWKDLYNGIIKYLDDADKQNKPA